MTDKEQALVAAAYRAAAEKCVSTVEEGNPLHIVAIGYSKAIAELSPAEAEAKLRALMMGVAITMMNRMYGERVWIEDPLRQIVDDVLNETQ